MTPNPQPKLRKSIPHLRDATAAQLGAFFAKRVFATEKTDGFAFEVGRDEEGLYSRTSNSLKTRDPNDYIKRAREKFGDRFDPTVSLSFAFAHCDVHEYVESLGDVMWDTWSIKGEFFAITERINGCYKPAATQYYSAMFGPCGMFVVHSQITDFCPIDHAIVGAITVDHDYLSVPAPKWGPESEGIVLHNTDGQRYKIFDPTFNERRKAK